MNQKPYWQLHNLFNNCEHKLFSSVVSEFCDISGIKCKYYVRDSSVHNDYLYGEDQMRDYLPFKETKILYDVTEEPTLTNTFGINSIDQIQYAMMPKEIFVRDVTECADILPTPGDVIKTIWNNRAYEVVDIGEEGHIFQLSKMIYEIILKPFRFSETSDTAEEITTSTLSLSGYGDDVEIEEESNLIDNYSDVDTNVYGY